MSLSLLIRSFATAFRADSRRKSKRLAAVVVESVERRLLLSSQNGATVFATPGTVGPTGNSNPLTSIPRLNSLVGAPVTLYLDFDGHTETDPSWTNGGQRQVTTPVYDNDGDLTTFSDDELHRIEEIWYRVSEDFFPFDVNVTTVAPPAFNDFGSLRISIGGAGGWLGATAGGVALIDSFSNAGSNTVFVFTDNLQDFDGTGAIVPTAMNASHEAGHALGLNHHSVYDANGTKTAEYDPGNARLGPIMGGAFNSERNTWTNAPANVAVTAFQDDLAVLTRAANQTFRFRSDDYGNTPGTGFQIPSTGANVSLRGVVERQTDVDMFQFETDAGPISFSVEGLNVRKVYRDNTLNPGTNLDTVLSLYDAAGRLIVSSNSPNSLFSTITATVGQGRYVLAVSSTGEYGSIGQYTLTGSVIPLPSTPTLLGPSGNIASLTPSFSWTLGANAVAYELEVDSVSKSVAGYYKAKITAPALAHLSLKTFEQGAYKARIRTVATNGTFSPWSSFVQFTVDIPVPSVPTIIRPKGLTGESFPVFEWTTGTNAVSYDFIVNRTDDNSRVIYRVNQKGNTYQHFTPLKDGSYSVAIRSRNLVGETSAWSGRTLFTVKAPIPTAPLVTAPVGKSTAVNPKFTWTAVTGAAYYDLRVDSLSLGKTDYLRLTSLTRTQTFYDGPFMPQGNYITYVRAINGNGVIGPWSAAKSFTLDLLPPAAPSVTAPRGLKDSPTIQVTSPTFTWTVPVRGVKYDLLVNNLTTQTAGVIRQNGLLTTSFASQSPLAQGSYRVWVRAYNAANEVGDWSLPFDFNIDEPTPAVPRITAPVPNSLGYVENANPTFTWTATTPAAASYDFILYDTNEAKNVIAVSGVKSPTYVVPTANRLQEHTYQARVRARNLSGDVSDWSQLLIFRVNIPDPTTPTLIGPGDTTTDTTPTFSWRHTSTSFSYEILVRDLLRNEDITFTVRTFSLEPGGVNASYTVPTANKLSAGTYRFWIRAFNSLGQASSWSTSKTFVITPLAENDQKPASESDLGLAASQITVALTDRKVVPVKVTPEAAPVEVTAASEDVLVADVPADNHVTPVPEVPGEESLIDAFMHRIADPAADADFSFLQA